MKATQRNPQSGVALLLVLMSLALMTVLSVEIISASRVELNIGRNAKERLQAYYLAQSGARLNLLRLHLYKEVRNKYLSLVKDKVDQVWAFPLPELPLPGMDGVDWPGKISGSVTTEGSKIPINMLDGVTARGSSDELSKDVRLQLTDLIGGMMKDEDFDKLYRGMKPDDLINPLEDWIDADNDRKDGGDESREYERRDPPYKPRNDRIPNLGELHLIENWNDDLVRRMAPHLTVLSNNGTVNPNYIPIDRLKAYGPQLTSEDLAYIDKRRSESPFTDLKNLENFIQTDPDIRGGKTFQFPTYLKGTTKETVFFVEGTGIVGSSRRSLRLGVRLQEIPPPPPPPPPAPAPQIDPNSIKLKDPEVVLVEEVL